MPAANATGFWFFQFFQGFPRATTMVATATMPASTLLPMQRALT
jgi:hypothetical protein